MRAHVRADRAVSGGRNRDNRDNRDNRGNRNDARVLTW
jgi:hypothetical protein